jgi:hypothetical protein
MLAIVESRSGFARFAMPASVLECFTVGRDWRARLNKRPLSLQIGSRLIEAFFQLLCLKPSDFFMLAAGNGGQGENFRPVDLMLAGNFPGALIGG